MSMSNLKAKHVSEIPYYQGPNAIPGIKFRMAARDLGVTAWGMNVLEIDAGCTGHPQHDHVKDGQEEVYVVLRGSGTLDGGDEKIALSSGLVVRVGPSQQRKILSGPEGITVLAIGGVPGQAYPSR
jgi:mannose-6-phosphate isomerase-like protein (cupin superfamily)